MARVGRLRLSRSGVVSLKTERLLLRPIVNDNFSLIAALHADPAVMHFIRPPQNVEEARKSFDKMLSVPAPLGFWTIWWQQQFVGWIGLFELDNSGEHEVGYRLHKKFWGKGIASEAVGEVLCYAFTKTSLEEVVAVTHPDNLASQKVLQKNGLQFFSVTDKYYAVKTHYFRLLKKHELAPSLLKDEDPSTVLALMNSRPDYAHMVEGRLPALDDVRSMLMAKPETCTFEQKVTLAWKKQGQLVAVTDMLLGFPEASILYLGLLMTHEKWAGCGVGEQVLWELIQQYKGPCHKIRIGILKQNTRAASFWAKQGFSFTGEIKSFQGHDTEIWLRHLYPPAPILIA